MSVLISDDVTKTAITYDLASLAIARDELNLSPNDHTRDAFLSRGITQVSYIVQRYCNRIFWPERITETQQIEQDPYPYQVPGGVRPMTLDRWPVIKVYSVKQIFPINVPNPFVEGTDFSVDKKTGLLTRLNPFTGVAVAWEALPTVIDYVAGYGAIAVEPTTIPANPGPYTYQALQGATFSYDEGVINTSSGAAFTAVTGAPGPGQYQIVVTPADPSDLSKPQKVTYTFNAADTGTGVTITYAYSNIPPDVTDVTLRGITQRWWSRDRDPLLMSIDQPNLGSKRWWVSRPGEQGTLPPEITGALAPYRVPVIA